MKKIIDGIPQWVEQYNSEQPRIATLKRNPRPNFATLTSEYFNGGSGDTATLYDVSKFIEKLYDEWVKT